MIDGGEVDYKVICINYDDPLCALLNDIDDLEVSVTNEVFVMPEIYENDPWVLLSSIDCFGGRAKKGDVVGGKSLKFNNNNTMVVLKWIIKILIQSKHHEWI